MLTIKVSVRDLPCLEYVKSVLGFGSISMFYGSYEYSLKDLPCLLILLKALDGHIVSKLVSYKLMCKHLGIIPTVPTVHSKTSSYFIGLFDSKGFINFFLSKIGIPSIQLAMFGKFKADLLPFKTIFGGTIKPVKSEFIWVI